MNEQLNSKLINVTSRIIRSHCQLEKPKKTKSRTPVVAK